MIQKTCPITGKAFPISPEDLAFYEKMGVPTPTLCPQERMRRRMTWRNERHLYTRKCDATQKPIISIFAPESPFKVYSQEYWWSDDWDPLGYGRAFDFNRPFFEQFQQLQHDVPRICLLSKTSENSEYTNHAANNKDCYMSVIVFNSENIFFSRKIFTSQFLADCEFMFQRCQWSSCCFFGENLYQCLHCITCFNSADLAFCVDCRGCRDCFMSSNLRNAQYVYRNTQLTKEAYEKKRNAYNLGSFQTYQALEAEFERLRKEKAFYPALRLEQCEHCRGDFLTHCKNCHECYYSSDGEDIRYSEDFDASSGSGSQDCMDCFGFGGSQLLYEVQAQSNGYNNIACSWSYDIKNSAYLDMCHNSQDCFGCVGVKKGKNGIFNKSYTQQEYESLSKRIVQHMKETGEWGEFFPISLSPFAYNETVAQEYYLLTKEQALKRGYRWREELNPSPQPPSLIKEGGVIPDTISEVPDSICEQVLYCEESGKPYKIQKAELKFYRQMNLPIPRLHPDVRHQKRMALRNPRKLFERQCQQCQKSLQTTYGPERPEKVLCESCYLKVVN